MEEKLRPRREMYYRMRSFKRGWLITLIGHLEQLEGWLEHVEFQAHGEFGCLNPLGNDPGHSHVH